MATMTPQQLRQWMTACLTRVEVPEEEAQRIAGVRLEAALRDPVGFDLFAARNLLHGAHAIFDGDGGLGQLVGGALWSSVCAWRRRMALPWLGHGGLLP